MFARTFKVVYRPTRNNFLLLPDQYYGVVSTYDTGCLKLQYNGRMHYASWAPQAGGGIKDNEIGINARAAKELDLHENDLVKCALIADVLNLRSVHVTPVSAKDWEIIELSTEKISASVLEQTRIVNSPQILLVWINKSMQVALTVDRLKPYMKFGRIDHNTQLIVAPNLYKNLTNGDTNDNDDKESAKLSRSRTSAHVRDDVTISAPPGLAHSATMATVKNSLQRNKRQDHMERLKKDLRRESSRVFEFRVIRGLWHEKAQESDVYIASSHLPEFMDLEQFYSMRTAGDKEYYVRVRRASEDSFDLPATIHPSIKLNANLMKLLNIKELERVVLRPKTTVVNFVEKIELFAHKKTHYKIIENAFKRFVIEKTQKGPMLLNQEEVVRLEDDLLVTVGILPEHFRYCVVDGQFLKESKIYAADLVRPVNEIIKEQPPAPSPLSVKDLIRLPEYDKIVDEVVSELRMNLCLNAQNSVLRQGNVLLTGAAGTGKTVLVERILEQLASQPDYCYFDIFYCSRSKGRKTESIQKDLRNIFTTCLLHAPAIVVLENLDVLAHAAGEQSSQDGEYFNRMADTVHQLIMQYTSSNAIAVIATVSELQTLNKRLSAPRGRHLFQTIARLPSLERADREIILRELCGHIATRDLDVVKFSNLTEGYRKCDLVQFVERAIFYAYRISKTQPLLTNEQLIESLEHTNSYCLQGIQSNQKTGFEPNEMRVEELPGLEPVVTVLEEVLMWPSTYPTIFNSSPLRNQAGVLLYGPPGTGKTFLVSQLASCWSLRIISVKGPELLAKYIGQSEENVRNLFNRARSAKPCVLFFDEFDSLAPKRGHDSTGVTDRVVNQLLTELDGVEGLQGVTVIAATSRPELLDPALLRSGRIDRLVECPLPDAVARVSIFEALSATLNLDECVDFDWFAARTQNYTGADIQSILTSANMAAVKEALAQFGHEKLPKKILVKQKHLIESFESTRPSLSASDVSKYKKTYARFTNKEKSSREFVAKRATLA
ncbi:GH15109 [Drosophila grimshawi]|uniref:Peroxisomal ATPase PEX1 n=1 Tax=Drosophila grimshawi TaxID=7222 RepID=B4IYS0_DROGR|nr:GH15109 [Drosophila grimshawi]